MSMYLQLPGGYADGVVFRAEARLQENRCLCETCAAFPAQLAHHRFEETSDVPLVVHALF